MATSIRSAAEQVDRGPAPRNQRLLLVGNPGVVHVGAHLAHAARTLGIPVQLLDLTRAFSSNLWINRFHRRLWGSRPAHLRGFSHLVLEACRSFHPTVLLATGTAPIECGALQAIHRLGTRTCNYLTDDPFSRAQRARWFIRALPAYDCIFSPRRANVTDLEAAGCDDVVYVPFAYAPEIHFPEAPAGPSESARFSSDVFFAGGADKDRIAYMSAMIRAGLRVALYGGSWDRYRETRAAALGLADARTVRKAAAGAKLSLCLVRRANRDGHSMRSFELPAMRVCPVVEDTPEHRAIFGPPGRAVAYFQTIAELLGTVRRLMVDEAARERLAGACHARICGGRNTYKDRLADMLARVAKG
jgi:spore maturation protein CgeB